MEIANLQRLLEQGQDSVILRFGLGNALFKSGQATEAIPHLKAALKFDPAYSAAWKILGKALSETGDTNQAIGAYENGILVAQEKGDIQAIKEMHVFLKRLIK